MSDRRAPDRLTPRRESRPGLDVPEPAKAKAREAAESVAKDRAAREGRLTRLVESLDIMTWEADAATWEFLYVSPQAEAILGYPVDAWFAPAFWVDHVHPDDRARVMDECATQSKRGGRYELEYRMIAADGRVVWLRDSVTVRVAEDGRQVLSGFMEDVTERKQRDDMLRRDAVVLANVHDAIIITGLDGIITDWNAGAEKVFGYSAAEAIGKPIGFRSPPERQPEIWRLFDEILAGTEFRGEWPDWHKDGSQIWVDSLVRPLLDDKGIPIGVLGLSRDITERKAAAEARRDSEQRFIRFMQSLPGLAWIKDEAGRYVYANDAATRAFGRKRDALYGKTDAEIFPPETAKQFRANDLRALASASGIQTVETLEQQGEIRHSIVSKFPIPAADETATLIGGMAIDITEQRRSEQALRENEEKIRRINDELERKVQERTRELEEARLKDHVNLQRLKSIIANLPMAAVAHDEHDVVIEANRHFCEAFELHCDPSELIGTRFWDLRAEILDSIVDKTRTISDLRELLKKREPSLDQEIRLTNGKILLRDYIPILENGKYHGQMLLYRDVTRERKVDASKSEFMSLASHQLRTPLTAIRWTLGRIGKDGASGRLVEEGKRAAARMSQTIDTMLAISRIESGSIRPELRREAIMDLLMEVQREFSDEAAKKPVQMTVACPADAVALTDRRFLKETLSILVGNAVKYTPAGGSVGMVVAMNGEHLTVSVCDSGIGIPSNQQARIFNKFFRGDNAIAQHTEGNGLGLYLASLMTRYIRGELSFRSAEGIGTTFMLRLPSG
jgi:PAS domain S-box-containing protein